MAVLQKLTLLSVNGQQANTVPDLNFPGVLPTAQSPCPFWSASNKHVMGMSAATAAQITSFPGAGTTIYYDWSNGNQRFTGTAIVHEDLATVTTGFA